MTVAIIDYGSGNLRSAAKAFERAAPKGRGRVRVTDDASALKDASRVVLPGVGAFADCMGGLAALPGLVEALDEAVRGRAVPFLGICVGMQLMATTGREHGDHAGLDWIGGEVVPVAGGAGLKVPHMGWNDIAVRAADHPVFAGLDTGTHVYFVHSYRFACDDPGDALATTEHGGPITAAVGRDNMVGTQFHPEKSQAAGLRLIANFLDWRP